MKTPDVIEQPEAPTPVACSDLLSCPFCRNQNISVEWEKCDRISSDDTDRLWWCECRYCGSHGPCANTEPEAKHRWQTRAHEFNTPLWEQRKRNPLGQDNAPGEPRGTKNQNL